MSSMKSVRLTTTAGHSAVLSDGRPEKEGSLYAPVEFLYSAA